MSDETPQQRAVGPDCGEGEHTTDHLNEADRRAAFSAGPPKMSRRVIATAVLALCVLAFGGIAVDHFFPGEGSPTPTSTTVSTLPAFLRKGASASKDAATSRTLNSNLDAMMDLTRLAAKPAPSFSLDTIGGSGLSLPSLRGKVVVLSFFNAGCNDICLVLAAEIRRANELLGPKAARVVFLTINTDPTHLSLQPVPAAIKRSGLDSLSNWEFLSGSARRLDPIWTSYGVAISVVTTTKVVSHNDVLDFIDTRGRLRFVATPYADENSKGIYSLDASTIDRWSSGIVKVIDALLRSPT